MDTFGCTMRSRNIPQIENEQQRVVVQVVPWQNKAEWEEVYASLYSTDLLKRRWAVDRVTVWKSRCHPTLPLGIDATAAIVRAVIQDILVVQNASLCQPADVSLLYSMSLVRFINLVSETGQMEHRTLPIRQIARKFGIPEWVVSIRHNATHSSTPSLEMLRNGAEFALTWLRKNFWEYQKEATIDWVPRKNEPPERKIREIISRFQEEQYDKFEILVVECDDQDTDTQVLYISLNDTERRKKKVILRSIIDDMTSLIKCHSSLFIEILMEPGFFIPNSQNLTAILTSDEIHFIDEESINLPKSLEEFWIPVLVILHQIELFQDLIECLLNFQSHTEAINQRIMLAWALKILKATVNTGNSDYVKSPVSTLLSKKKPLFEWLRILAACLQSPCKYAPAVLPLIIEHIDPPLSEVQKHHVMALVAVYLGAITDKYSLQKHIESPRIFNVEELKRTKEQEDAVRKGGKKLPSNKSNWKLSAEPYEWGSHPLGTVFGLETLLGIDDLDLTKTLPRAEELLEEHHEGTQCDENDIQNKIAIELPQNQSIQEDNMQIEDCTEESGGGDAQKNTVCQLEDIQFL